MPILSFLMLPRHVGPTDLKNFLGKKMQEFSRLQLCQPSTLNRHYLQHHMLAQMHSFGELLKFGRRLVSGTLAFEIQIKPLKSTYCRRVYWWFERLCSSQANPR